MRRAARRAAWLAMAALACESTPPAALLPPPAYADEGPGGFSAERAWQHLAALTEIGPRVTGSPGAARAREYIGGQLRALGLEVEERTDPEGSEPLPDAVLGPSELRAHNLLAVIPGASADLVVLAAPYDSRSFQTFEFVGANDGASGAAVLLELAAVLVAEPQPYTTWLLFLDGEARLRRDVAPGESLPAGSQLEARRLVLGGLVPRVRLLVAFNRVCDADLRIARDLMSNRIYREEFWAAAVRLGHTQVFPPAQHFESPLGSHLPFRSAGLSRLMVVSDTSFGGDEPPGLYADSEDDRLEHCSARSLEVVGAVALEALRTISQRLAKIDRFSSSPAAELEPAGNESPERPAPETRPGAGAPADGAAGAPVVGEDTAAAPPPTAPSR